jgi:hypothetical protein
MFMYLEPGVAGNQTPHAGVQASPSLGADLLNAVEEEYISPVSLYGA